MKMVVHGMKTHVGMQLRRVIWRYYNGLEEMVAPGMKRHVCIMQQDMLI
jgi:hypothetical protein